jgi:hypothetical protein
MSDDDGPGHDEPDEPEPVTKEEANRDFRKKSRESQQEFLLRFGVDLKRHLDAMGLPVDDPVASHGTTSVYLKGRGHDLQVRIADHAPKPGRKSDTPAREHLLLIKGPG